MRKNFYELLAERAFDTKKEYATLWHLFCKETHFYGRSMARYIDEAYFRGLSFRGTFASLFDMMDELGIQEDADIDLDRLLLFCEMLCALITQEDIASDGDLEELKNTIAQNISYILEHTNHALHKDANGNYIIVEKNKTATMAAQLVDDQNVAFEIIEYNHFALKGDLSGKKSVLVSLAMYIEPILKSHILQQNGYKQLESDAGFLLNNFHIRHNNKVGAKAQDYIISVEDSELEEWYDKAYEVALSVIIIKDYLTIKKDIEDIKSQYAWKS